MMITEENSMIRRNFTLSHGTAGMEPEEKGTIYPSLQVVKMQIHLEESSWEDSASTGFL